MRDSLYDRLNVSPDADLDQIRRAYRRSAQQFHPDRADSDEQRDEFNRWFVLINEAWRTLSNADERAAYDAEHGFARRRAWSGRRRAVANLVGRALHRRPAWFLRQQRAGSLGRLRGLTTDLASLAYQTRIGQWAILLLSSLAIHAVLAPSGDLRTPLLLGLSAGIAWLLARGGDPTPLTDAQALMFSLAPPLLRGTLTGVGRLTATALRAWASRDRVRPVPPGAAAAPPGPDHGGRRTPGPSAEPTPSSVGRREV